jgi:hypothetical protein
MYIQATRAVWRWVTPATVAVTAGLIGPAAAVPAAAAPQDSVVHCPSEDLQTAINSAPAGGTLRVDGTCVGNFTIAKNLTVIGGKSAALDGGGSFNPAVTITGSGSQVHLKSLTITHHTANTGGGILNAGGVVTLDRSTVSANASNTGGGIYNTSGGNLTLNGSTVRDNTAVLGGGGIYNGSGSTVALNRSNVSHNGAPAGGGGILNLGTLTLQDSTVSDNTATNGGGINNVGTANLFRSTVKDNYAVQTGGGIFNNGGGSVTLDHSTVLRNRAIHGTGGGIDNAPGGTVTLLHSTFHQNHPNHCVPLSSIPGCNG